MLHHSPLLNIELFRTGFLAFLFPASLFLASCQTREPSPSERLGHGTFQQEAFEATRPTPPTKSMGHYKTEFNLPGVDDLEDPQGRESTNNNFSSNNSHHKPFVRIETVSARDIGSINNSGRRSTRIERFDEIKSTNHPDSYSNRHSQNIRPSSEAALDAILQENANKAGSLIRKRSPLNLNEKLRLQTALENMIASVLLKVGDESEHRKLIFDGFDRLDTPGRKIKHLMAIYYNELGLEGKRDELFPAAGNAANNYQQPRISVKNFAAKKILRNGRSDRDFKFDRVVAGDKLLLVCDVWHLRYEKENGSFRSELRVDVSTKNHKGIEVDRRILNENLLDIDQSIPEFLALNLNYDIPLRFGLQKGFYKIDFLFTDLSTGFSATKTLEVQLQ